MAETPHSYEIFVLDDNSRDGTSEAIQRLFPEVTIVRGSGSLYWTRGMSKAYEASLMSKSHDAYILFNDDVEVFPGAAASALIEYERMNQSQSTIVVGSTVSRISAQTTYSAFLETSQIKALAFSPMGKVDQPTACHTFNGNFVIVPGIFFRSIDGLDAKFHHGLGDIDLGLVARRHGLRSVLLADPVGYCEKGPELDARLANAGFAQRWRILFSAPNGLYPYAHFVWKHRPRMLFPAYLAASCLKRLLRLFRIA